MNDFVPLLLWSLGRTTLWLAAAALVTTFVLRVARPSWPAAHRFAWLAVLLVGWSFIRMPVAVPWYEAQLPEPAKTVELAPGELFVDREPQIEVIELAPPSDEVPATAPAVVTPGPVAQLPVATNRINWPILLLGAWALGAAALAAAWGIGYVLFVRSLARRVPVGEVHRAEWRELLAAEGVRREIPLFTTEKFGPLLCRLPRGFEIIVPESLWRELTARERTAILRHELAHYQRGDVWTSLVARVLALPHWFNPAAWWAARQFDEAAELACDRAAAGDDATTDYANALVRLGQVSPRAAFYGTAARGRSLAARIRRVLAGPSTEDSLMKKASLIAIALGIAAASVVQIDLVAQQPAGEEKKPAEETEPVEPTPPPTKQAPVENEPKIAASRAAAQKMMDEALAAFEANQAAYEAETVTIDRLYDWSLRWMRAAQIAAVNDEQNTAAIQAHLDRMRALQKRIAVLYKTGSRGGEAKDMRAANFYVTEAERWLAEADTPAMHRSGSAVPDNTATPGSITFDLKIKIADLRGELAQAYIDLQKTNRILDAMNQAKPGVIAVAELARWKADAQKLEVRLATLTEQLQLYENKLRLVERSPKEQKALSQLGQLPPSRPALSERATPASERQGATRGEQADPATQVVDLKIAMSEIEKEISQTDIELKLARELLTDTTLSAREMSRLRADAEKAELQRSYLAKRLSLYREKAKLLDTQLWDRPDGGTATDGKTAKPEPADGGTSGGVKGVRFEDKDFDSWAEELRNELSSERRVKAIHALATFGASGYGPQAAELILEAGRAYPLWINRGGELAETAVAAFRVIPSKDSLPLVLKSLDSDDAGERLFAVNVFPEVSPNPIETAKRLAAMLKDPDTNVRQAAMMKLVPYKPAPPEFVATLRECLASNEPAQVRFAARAVCGTFEAGARGAKPIVDTKLLEELLPDLFVALERPDPYGRLVEQALDRLVVDAWAILDAAIDSSGASPGPRAQEFLEKRLGKKVEKK